MRVRISDVAQSELEAIADYIADDNAARAGSFTQELLDRCATLGTHANRHPVIASLRGEEFRRVPHRNYLIVYSVVDGEVRVHHIVHSARDYMRLLFPDD